MKLTKEQSEIIQSTGNIKINAVAGSGKTTTIIEYARTRPNSAKILYLAFNKSVKLEALKKFADQGLDNVKVETAHSLAYKHIVYKHGYSVRAQGYKTNEISELLKLKGNGEKHNEYVIANHVLKYIAYFCNSDKATLKDLNYLDTVSDPKANAFVLSFYNYIQSKAQVFLNKMDSGEIEITHDFYLKKFQLSEPQLNYDFILFDEGQDASAAMLQVFFNQKATKVIVGDTHQQIYGWRYAVNSLEKADYKTYNLSTSFRFSQPIANLAMNILKWKSYIDQPNHLAIIGKGNSHSNGTKAVIARTNLGLLLKAIEYVTERKDLKQIYFEGNINSYTYADDGASLYDVLNLFNDKPHLIRDKMIRGMKDMEELEDYIDKTEDVQLGMMVDIIKEYGNKIPHIIKTIKEKHVEHDAKEKAELIFSTVHRCKGMEYDSIQLANDFMTEEKLEKIKDNTKAKEAYGHKLNEEINLLYVAVTRTKNTIHIPEALLPKDFEPSAQIKVIELKPVKAELENERVKQTSYQVKDSKRKAESAEKAYSVTEIRNKHKAAYQKWSPELDKDLMALYEKGTELNELITYFGRTSGAITSRIRKLEGIEMVSD